jgi:hypothetical protein
MRHLCGTVASAMRHRWVGDASLQALGSKAAFDRTERVAAGSC